MNSKLGMSASLINALAVFGFALAMLFGSIYLSYLSSIFIAFSFVLLSSAFVHFCMPERRVAAYAGFGFALMYALCNSIVYFVQISTVSAGLPDAAATYLDFQQFGMIFNLDMLGYCLMALSTFFLGLTLSAKTKSESWLKWLLLIHGVFAISCFTLPLLGLFSADMSGAEWIGTAVLEFWCVYFLPISILSYIYFSKCATE